MKKIAALIISILITLSFAGCFGSSTNNKATADTSQSDVTTHFTYLGAEPSLVLYYWVDNLTDIVYISKTHGTRSGLTPLVKNGNSNVCYVTREDFEKYNKEHGIALETD